MRSSSDCRFIENPPLIMDSRPIHPG
jgi:hypothetical protein